MFSKIVSKMLVNEGILGGRGKEVFFLIFAVGKLMGGDVGEDVETKDWGGGDGGASDDVRGAVGDVEKGVILWVVEDGPGKFGGWGTGDKRSGCWGSVCVKIRTWEIPSVVVGLEDFKDGSGSVGNILLVYVIKGQPRGDGDVGEGRGGNDGGLRSSEGHFTYTVSST